MKQNAIFFDRDGTLIEEVDFLSTAEETKLFPFTIEALTLLRDAGFIFFVTTNQSGIARGYFGAQAVNSIHHKIIDELATAGLKIERFEYCPHFPDDGCSCRKPNIGMIEKAIANYDIDLESSWVIGDKNLDILMGQNAGTRTALVRTGYGTEHEALLKIPADIVADNLLQAAKQIVRT
ncbi:MAG: D-glycero-alpha-D-manno-heptose-1,7-bisphosphate 7-phosphatase [Pyrinomonadaceae bacterium]